MAQYYFRRKKLDDCVTICTEILQNNPYDQVSYFFVVWYPRQPVYAPPPVGCLVSKDAGRHGADVRGRSGDGR